MSTSQTFTFTSQPQTEPLSQSHPVPTLPIPLTTHILPTTLLPRPLTTPDISLGTRLSVLIPVYPTSNPQRLTVRRKPETGYPTGKRV